MVPFFQVQNLSHAYGRNTPFETRSLSAVSLQVEREEIVGLIGPTGSGKSTLLQHLCGLLRPQGGRVWVAGSDLADPEIDVRSIRQRVGMVFQLPEDQLFARYVGDDVAFGPRNQGLERSAIRERVRSALDAVGLPFAAFKDRLTLTLSGGERRKVAIAGVLAMSPDALLLDEPTAGLDPAGRRELLDLLKRCHAEQGMTMIVSSHNMDDLAELTSRIYVLHNGRIALEGTTRDIFAHAQPLRELGLEVPAVTQIIDTLCAAGIPLERGALTLEEAGEAILRLWKGRA